MEGADDIWLLTAGRSCSKGVGECGGLLLNQGLGLFHGDEAGGETVLILQDASFHRGDLVVNRTRIGRISRRFGRDQATRAGRIRNKVIKLGDQASWTIEERLNLVRIILQSEIELGLVHD